MYSRGGQKFWIDKLAQLRNERFVIPTNWVMRATVEDEGTAAPAGVMELHSDVRVVEFTHNGWRLTGELLSVRASAFWKDYEQVLADIGGEVVWADDLNAPEMPNPLRKHVEDGEDLYVVMVWPWADDVSGNQSKQYNKHMNMYVVNGSIPGRLQQQEFHIHFYSTSPYATSSEQFSAFRDQVRYVCHCQLLYFSDAQ